MTPIIPPVAAHFLIWISVIALGILTKDFGLEWEKTTGFFAILRISKEDAFKQYLAYHEGWGNYKNYKKNKKVIKLAKKVEKQAKIYKKQLSECGNLLNKNKYIIF